MPPAHQVPFLFPGGARLGKDNVLLHARARRHQVENYAGPLSIKTVVAGQVSWIIARRELVVDPSSFLIVSAGEKYSMNIAASSPVETCCAFFAPGFVERTVLDATSPLAQSLDDPERAAPASPYLSGAHTDAERSLVGRVQSLVARCNKSLAPSAWEEDFLLLALDLQRFHQRVHEQAARIPAARNSTRQELFRRLLVGREYMHSHSSGPVSLTSASRAACLSPFHFHRGFTKAFEQTPHAYLTGLRMAQARRMLEAGSLVLDACLDSGFTSPSAFTRLFQSRYGERPSEVRGKFARSGKRSGGDSATVNA
ncbi:MAG TPA: AraC family transcriptional regulator [Bryobacteraceae bacterium]|jgi:AraC family transcriptional regulator|nr:AraC family transcriptional regulator [Bryobacteraceae bacterium]